MVKLMNGEETFRPTFVSEAVCTLSMMACVNIA